MRSAHTSSLRAQGTKEVRFSDEVVSYPTMIVADPTDRFFVSDQGPARILMLGSDGQVLRRIGREGSGPGEYRAPSLGAIANGLFVHDAQLRRLSAFSLDGKIRWTRPSTCCGLHKVGLDSRGRIYVLSRPLVFGIPILEAAVYAYDSLGAFVDSVIVPNAVPGGATMWNRTSSEGATSVPVPFTPAAYYLVTPSGSLVFGFSSEYVLYRARSARDGVVVIRRPWRPEPLPPEVRERAVGALVDEFSRFVGRRQAMDMFKSEDVPRTGQAFYGLDSDACGRIWVLRSPPDQGDTRFDIFDAEGKFVEEFRIKGLLLSPPRWAVGKRTLSAVFEDAQGAPRIGMVPVRLSNHDAC